MRIFTYHGGSRNVAPAIIKGILHIFLKSYKTQIYSVSSFWFHLIHLIGFSQTWVWEFVY